MNKQILTRSILLALAMSAAIPAGQAWAETSVTEGRETINITLQDYDGENLNETWKNKDIVVTKIASVFDTSATAPALWAQSVNLEDTDFDVTTASLFLPNVDGLRFRDSNLNVKLGNFTADIRSINSDAIVIGDESSNNHLTINGDFHAEILSGMGLRVSSCKWSSANATSSEAVINGETNITIKGNPLANADIWNLKYNQGAAIYAGADEAGGDNNQANISLNGKVNLLLNTETDEEKGLYGLWAGKNGHIETHSDVTVYSNNAHSGGIAATNTISNTGKENGQNIHGSNVILGGQDSVIDITMENSESYALYASGDNTSIKTNDAGVATILFKGDVKAENGGIVQLNVTGNDWNFLNGDVRADGGENKQAVVELNVKNELSGQGTLAAANGGIVDLTLGAGSNWTGRADDYGDANGGGSAHTTFVDPEFDNITSGGAVNLTMGNDAVWNVDGQSWITNLTASGDNMFINLLGTEADRNANADALTIYNLKGHATFAMHLDGERSGSDMLYIKNTDNSSYDVYLDELVTAEDMYQNGTFKDGLRFATVGKDNVTFNVYSLNQGIYNLKYQVKQTEYNKTEKDINEAYNEGTDSAKPGSDMVEDFFTSEGKPPSIQNEGLAAQDTTEVNTTGNFWNYNLVDVQDRQISDAGKTIIAMSKVNYSNAVYMDRLNKRMGEARFLEGDDGLWVRLRHDRIGKSDAFRSKNTMFEIGYDWKDNDQKDGTHYRGFAFDYMRGTADYTNVLGEGDVRRAGLWYHDTWMGDKGHYTDYVVKYGRLSNDFDIYGRTTGEKISGDYDNDVWSVSAEYGRKKDLGNDWYIEPQAQLQYAYVTDASYTTSQETKVDLDSIDSLIGRAGFRLGRDTDEANTVYFKADILHEFLGDQDIRAMDKTGTLAVTYENEGTWYDVGFGFSHRMSKDKYMFLDVEKLFGNDNEDTYQVNIGLNMAF